MGVRGALVVCGGRVHAEVEGGDGDLAGSNPSTSPNGAHEEEPWIEIDDSNVRFLDSVATSYFRWMQHALFGDSCDPSTVNLTEAWESRWRDSGPASAGH